jgi:serine/threonine-protein phosphatase 6 regulatory ankyrin repeat subunit A
MKKCNIIDDISIKMMSTDFNHNPDYDDKTLLELIKPLPDINMKGRDGRTLLIHSALYNRIEIAKWLLEKGAYIDEQDMLGLSALHCAVISNNCKVAKYLLEQGASIDIRDNFGNTPLMRAGLNVDIIKLLLDYGANCTLENNSGITPFKMYEAYPDILSLFKK